MKFTKMHGIGNDYIYINCLEEQVEDPCALARKVSDVHFGVGSDGLILICPSDTADFRMRMFNVDGTEGEMCGNGIRCVGKYVYDHGLTDKTEFSVSTLGGTKILHLTVEDGKAKWIRVDMGCPVLEPVRIPVCVQEGSDAPLIGAPIEAAGRTWSFTAVSMGNPHCVVMTEDPMLLDLEKVGPAFENHPYFPERVNTEFISVLDEDTIRMRVWERGSGETWACGTGACASAAAAWLLGKSKRCVTVKLLGGDLKIEWDINDGHIYMTGPAETIFEGEFDDDWLKQPART